MYSHSSTAAEQGRYRRMSAQVLAPHFKTPDRQLLDAARYASEDDFVQMMNAALEQGADMNVTDERGNNLLEIAVQRNSSRMVRVLISRGVDLPSVPADGVDLIMRAASMDNADIIHFLKNVADMLVDCGDRWGKTALHYAVKAHSTLAVEALLQCGADVNAAAERITAKELNDIFGEYHSLYEVGVTPLTMAAASHNLVIAKTLLAWGAEISTGVTNPLLIAIKSRDVAMLDLLISHCLQSGKLAEVIDQRLIDTWMATTTETGLLGKILDCHQQYALKGLDLNDALEFAVTLGHVDQAAMLIAYGARPDSATNDGQAIWVSASQLQDPAILNLLATTRSEQFATLLKSSQPGQATLLTVLCALVTEPVNLAQHGIFGASVAPAVPELLRIAQRRDELSAAQIAAESAHALLSLVPSPAADTEWPHIHITNDQPLVSAFALQQVFSRPTHLQHPRIQHAIDVQRDQLIAAALPEVTSLQTALTAVLSTDFFLSAKEASATRREEADIKHILSEKMRTIHGLPEPLIQLISDCWLQSQSTLFNHENLMPEAVTLSGLMTNILFCKLDELIAEPGSFTARCKNTLLGILSASRAQWQTLIKHPAEFLRSVEGRIGWRPVNLRSLTHSLQMATGLPPAVCIAIATCWQQAVSEASEVVDSERLNQRFAALDAAFARRWRGWLEEHAADAGEAELPITPQEVLESIYICEQAQQRPVQTRKRKAISEAPGAPTAKPPRLQ